MNPNIFSDLRKPGLVSGKSLSLSAKIYSVKEKYSSYNMTNRMRSIHMNLYNCLMIYYNTPLTGSLQSPMQILQGRSARSDLPMSNAARKQLSIQPEVSRNIEKHEVLPTHELHVGQSVVYQDSVTN